MTCGRGDGGQEVDQEEGRSSAEEDGRLNGRVG